MASRGGALQDKQGRSSDDDQVLQRVQIIRQICSDEAGPRSIQEVNRRSEPDPVIAKQVHGD